MKNTKLHETTEAPAEARMTSRQLAQLHGLDRDRMEAALTRLGLRGPDHDGASLYSTGEVARRFDEEDRLRFAAAGESLASFTENAALAAHIVEGIVAEETERWIAENALLEGVLALKAKLLTWLRKTHRYQTARRLGDAAAELTALQDFGAALLTATRERRAAESERDQSHQPASAGDIGGTNERQTAE